MANKWGRIATVCLIGASLNLGTATAVDDGEGSNNMLERKFLGRLGAELSEHIEEVGDNQLVNVEKEDGGSSALGQVQASSHPERSHGIREFGLGQELLELDAHVHVEKPESNVTHENHKQHSVDKVSTEKQRNVKVKLGKDALELLKSISKEINRDVEMAKKISKELEDAALKLEQKLESIGNKSDNIEKALHDKGGIDPTEVQILIVEIGNLAAKIGAEGEEVKRKIDDVEAGVEQIKEHVDELDNNVAEEVEKVTSPGKPGFMAKLKGFFGFN